MIRVDLDLRTVENIRRRVIGARTEVLPSGVRVSIANSATIYVAANGGVEMSIYTDAASATFLRRLATEMLAAADELEAQPSTEG